jgi:hypothetical protein
MNPAVTDIPTYGPCLSVNADPPLSDVMGTENGNLIFAATVFICDISVDLGSMSHDQQERVTMHRWDSGPETLNALPHAPHACAPSVGSAGVKGFFANLARGDFGHAGRQLASLLTPRPLYAAAMLDVGAGGFTFEFSAFQFALPSKIAIVAGTGDGAVVTPGTVLNPKVLLTDLGGDPVEGATVRFVTDLFECDPNSEGEVGSAAVLATVVTPANGEASTPWTINSGANTLWACGRGLGGDDVSGPRGQGDGDSAVDPFQPLSTNLGDGSDGPEVLVQTGSVEFNATGTAIIGRIRAVPTTTTPLVNRNR